MTSDTGSLTVRPATEADLQDIAEMVDTTEAAVKMQVKRAFERLRGELLAFALCPLFLLFG